MATQPSKPSPEVLAKLKQLREQFAAKAEMERRRRQAQDNWEQSDTYKRQYPQGEAEGGRVPSLDEMRLAITKAKGGSSRPVETTVKLGDRELPITMDVYDKRAGNKIVHVNPDTFDKAFQKSSWQYVGPKGEGGIKDRYSRFADYAKSAKSANASNAGVNKEGVITFGDGRHRYAYMRDQGLDKIPMSMDKQSIEHARRYGYLQEAKGGRVTHAHHLEIEERPL